MSQGSDTDAAVVVESDGVSVEKRYTADEFPVPAVRFAVRSERDAPAEFRVVDRIPEEFPMDHIGFHPEYDNDGWTAYQDHRVEYRCTLDPGEERVTVYGVRTDDPDEGAKFLAEPTVEEVDEDDDPAGNVAEVIGEDSSQVVRDVLAGERETVPGGTGLDLSAAEADLDPAGDDTDDPLAADDAAGWVDDAPADAEDEPAEPTAGSIEALEGDVADAEPERVELDADAPLALEEGDDAGAAAEPERVEPDADADDVDADDPLGGADADGGVAAALAAELRAGDVSEADRATLGRELDLDLDPTPAADASHTTSVDARVSRLQSDVADLAAYTDALETFLDDNGTAEELAEGLHDEVADLRESLDEVEERVGAADDRGDALEADVEGVRESVAELDDEVSATADGLEDEVESVRDDLDALAADVAADDAVAAVRDDVAALREEVSAARDAVDDETDDVRDDIAELRAELREFETFRDRLSSAFGADATGGVADGSDDDGGADDGDE